jgi:2-polyprenyl-6-methoxyphenol hydroxylase-like FAD-dependent oxidoreductase
VKLRTDVLIVGAGPVGLTLAAFLGRHGVTTTVVESRSSRTPRDESRAITWMPEGLLAADELGITDELRAQAVVRRYHDFLRRPGERAVLTLDMSRLRHRHRYTLNLPQGDTEVVLERAALATGHVQVLRGVRPSAVATVPGGVTAVLHHDDGATTEVEAEFGAACDGASSVRTGVGRLLGLESRRRDYGVHSVVADVELAADPAPTDPRGSHWIRDARSVPSASATAGGGSSTGSTGARARTSRPPRSSSRSSSTAPSRE